MPVPPALQNLMGGVTYGLSGQHLLDELKQAPQNAAAIPGNLMDMFGLKVPEFLQTDRQKMVNQMNQQSSQDRLNRANESFKRQAATPASKQSVWAK